MRRGLLAAAAVLGLAASAAAAELPRLEEGPCVGRYAARLTAAGARCGRLVVPEVRGREPVRELRLPVAVLPPTGPDPAEDPVVFLHGGPGGSALDFAARWLDHPLRERRALVLFDQRGTALAEPALCPELSRDDFRVMARNLRPEQEEAPRVALALRCRDALRAAGLDLGAWNSDASADDVEDLRRVLGYERWNVFGLSYGTKLALTLLRRHPDAVRSVVLDSVYPPDVPGFDARAENFGRALDVLAEACAADPPCAGTFGDPREDLRAVLEALDERPLTVAIGDTALLPSGRFTVNASDFAISVHQLLYDARALPALPLLLRAFRERPEEVGRSFASAMTERAVSLSRATSLAVECYERAPFASREHRDELAAAWPLLQQDFVYFTADYPICAAWSEERAGPREERPVVSDVPALVLAGEEDPITPPAWSRRAASTLRASSFHLFPAVGHGVDRSSGCARSLVAAFLEAPDIAPDASCVAAAEPLRFVTRYRPSPGLYSWLHATLVERAPAAVLGASLLALVLLSGALGWPLAAGVRLARGAAGPGGVAARAWLGAAAAAALLFWAGVLVASLQAANETPLLLLAGLPAWTGPLFALPWIALVLVALGGDTLVRTRAQLGELRFTHALLVGTAALVAAVLPFAMRLA